MIGSKVKLPSILRPNGKKFVFQAWVNNTLYEIRLDHVHRDQTHDIWDYVLVSKDTGIELANGSFEIRINRDTENSVDHLIQEALLDWSNRTLRFSDSFNRTVSDRLRSSGAKRDENGQNIKYVSQMAPDVNYIL